MNKTKIFLEISKSEHFEKSPNCFLQSGFGCKESQTRGKNFFAVFSVPILGKIVRACKEFQNFQRKIFINILWYPRYSGVCL